MPYIIRGVADVGEDRDDLQAVFGAAVVAVSLRLRNARGGGGAACRRKLEALRRTPARGHLGLAVRFFSSVASLRAMPSEIFAGRCCCTYFSRPRIGASVYVSCLSSAHAAVAAVVGPNTFFVCVDSCHGR